MFVMEQFFVGNETVFKGENVSDYHLKKRAKALRMRTILIPVIHLITFQKKLTTIIYRSKFFKKINMFKLDSEKNERGHW